MESDDHVDTGLLTLQAFPKTKRPLFPAKLSAKTEEKLSFPRALLSIESVVTALS